MIRSEAIAAGRTIYDGRPCARCRGTKRYVANWACVPCNDRHARRSVDREPERRRDVSRNSARRAYAADPEVFRAKSRDYYVANREECCHRARLWRTANPETMRLAGQRWRHSHPHLAVVYMSNRRARLRRSVPPWFTAEHHAMIIRMADDARRHGLTLDHIVPLAGCKVCKAHGLHVPWNLQAIPPADNSSKHNRCQECWEPRASLSGGS